VKEKLTVALATSTVPLAAGVHSANEWVGLNCFILIVFFQLGVILAAVLLRDRP
jgi:hypothetical protein